MMLKETQTSQEVVTSADVGRDGFSAQSEHEHEVVDNRSSKLPWTVKVLAVVLVSSIGFGSHWSSGVTGAMKATLKKVSKTSGAPRLICSNLNLSFRSCTLTIRNMPY